MVVALVVLALAGISCCVPATSSPCSICWTSREHSDGQTPSHARLYDQGGGRHRREIAKTGRRYCLWPQRQCGDPAFDDTSSKSAGWTATSTSAPTHESRAALKLAKASFPEDAAKRIVVVSDGNENLGDARSLAATLAQDGIGIDVAPVNLEARRKWRSRRSLCRPTFVRATDRDSCRPPQLCLATVGGRLRVTRRTGEQDQLLSEDDVELKPGKNVYSFVHKIEQTAVYTYQATSCHSTRATTRWPKQPRDGLHACPRKGRVLLIENWQTPGEFDDLVERLRKMNLKSP